MPEILTGRPRFEGPIKWVKPDLIYERGEVMRTARMFTDTEAQYLALVNKIREKFSEAQLEDLTDEMWARLENTDSYDLAVGDFKSLAEVAIANKREWESKVRAIEEGSEIQAPILLEYNGIAHKVSGNTRLMIARVLGQRPKVLVIRCDRAELAQ